jgi:uncharacterized protein YkwD
MEHDFKRMQSEHFALREYVMHLQSRLLDAQGEVPQPPPNLNLSAPPIPAGASASISETSTVNPTTGTPLEAVAQAVAGLAAQEQLAERQQLANKNFRPENSEDEARTAEEINRQLQPEGLPALAPSAAM